MSDSSKILGDEDVILLRVAMRIGPGEMKKIIDDALARKGRDPLEDYYLLIEELRRIAGNENNKKTT